MPRASRVGHSSPTCGSIVVEFAPAESELPLPRGRAKGRVRDSWRPNSCTPIWVPLLLRKLQVYRERCGPLARAKTALPFPRTMTRAWTMLQRASRLRAQVSTVRKGAPPGGAITQWGRHWLPPGRMNACRTLQSARPICFPTPSRLADVLDPIKTTKQEAKHAGYLSWFPWSSCPSIATLAYPPRRAQIPAGLSRRRRKHDQRPP